LGEVQHRKEKPWDNESINHWEIKPFIKEDNPSGLLEESSFATLFPKYRGTCVRPLKQWETSVWDLTMFLLF